MQKRTHVSGFQEGWRPGAKVGLPALLLNKAHGLSKCILREDVGSVAIEGALDFKGFFSSPAQHFLDEELGEF